MLGIQHFSFGNPFSPPPMILSTGHPQAQSAEIQTRASEVVLNTRYLAISNVRFLKVVYLVNTTTNIVKLKVCPQIRLQWKGVRSQWVFFWFFFRVSMTEQLSGVVGVWSAREKSLEILRRGWESNPGHGEDRQWAIPLSYHDRQKNIVKVKVCPQIRLHWKGVRSQWCIWGKCHSSFSPFLTVSHDSSAQWQAL